MGKNIGFWALTGALLLGCSPASSQVEQQSTEQVEQTVQTTAPELPQACAAAEYRQLDFWVGVWDLEWDLPDGTVGGGTNTITRSPFGDCVITENFDGAPTMQFKGMSVSTYHRPVGKWRQTWVDDQGGYFALSGGMNADGTFALVNTRLGDKGPHLRMIWVDIQPDSLTWRWQGKATEDAGWQDRWVIRYKRRS